MLKKFSGGFNLIVTIFTSDKRFKYLADRLRKDGNFVFENTEKFINITRVIVVPFPATLEKLSCIQEISSSRLDDKTVFAGLVNDEVRKIFTSKGAKVVDYMKDFALMNDNAAYTVEGALSVATNANDRALYNSECLVTGYGRIAKRLCVALKALGANVTVAIRRPELSNKLIKDGYNVTDFEKFGGLQKYNYIFNTVPSIVFDKNSLLLIDKNCAIIELASKPGGFDLEFAESENIKIINAQGLPGKYTAQAAAESIYKVINKYLKQEEFI